MTFRDNRINELFMVSLDLFAAYGYKKTTLDDVAGKLGMTKGNIYYYFENKQDLYEKTIEYALTQWKDSVGAAVSGRIGTVDRFRTMAMASMEYVEQHPSLRRVLVNDPTIFTLSPDEDRFFEINRSSRHMLRAILEKGMAEGVFYAMDLDSVTEYLFSVYIMFLIKTYVKSHTGPSGAMFTAALELTLRGLVRGDAGTQPDFKGDFP
ncbi:MAG: TetR/AcrR family transcriptional regulator [Pseudomonadota bacterium]